MKIGLVCPYRLSIPGGVREHVLALFAEFKKRGHGVKIIAPYDSKTEISDDFLPLGRSIRVPTPNKSWADMSVYLGERQKPLSEIFSEQNFDILHFHEPLAPFLSWQILQASKTKNIATFHSSWEDDYSLNPLRYLLEPLGGYFQTRLDGVIAVSTVAQRCWAPFFKKGGMIIPNGVDLKRFNPNLTKLPQYKDGKISILFVGRFEPRKGVFYLLQAIKVLSKRFTQLRVILVGVGPQLWQAKLWVKAQGLEDFVEFVGKVSDKDLPSYYASADIFCSPAIGGESFGIVLLEAMAGGLPLVVFANLGYKEVLRNYPCKECLVEPKNTEELTRSLKLLILDEAQRKKLSFWGLSEVQKYAWPKVADQVLDFYQEIL